MYREGLALFNGGRQKVEAVECLEGLAAVLPGVGEAERAARLAGAAEALRGVMGVPLPPTDQADHEQTVATVREVLGEAAFVAAWEVGRSLSLEVAVAEALAEEVDA